MVPYLIPVVTATCPRRLNHPVIHDASGALDGFDNIAAQKYGPPDVGCALQISEWSHDEGESHVACGVLPYPP